MSRSVMGLAREENISAFDYKHAGETKRIFT